MAFELKIDAFLSM
jgi:hypothetical protein